MSTHEESPATAAGSPHGGSAMRGRDLADLFLLAALWGGSFLFIRVAGPQFGAVPMMAMRATIGALSLLPVLWLAGQWGSLRAHAPRIAVMGLVNSALPFVLFGYALVHLSAGMGAVLNATAPFWAALVAFVWFGERLGASRLLGLGVGFAGVFVLVGDRFSFGSGGAALPVLATLAATLSYGYSANYARRFMQGIGPIASAAGSQVSAALMLAPFAFFSWPARAPDALAWGSVALLGLLSTGLGYVLFFRLLARVGPARAITVTFLVPVFGMLWGALFLGESVTANMVAGAATILAGTALTTGLVAPLRRFERPRAS